MELQRLTVGPLAENTYLVWEKERGVLIDPGDEPERIEAALEAAGVNPQAILLTHAHFDHVGAVAHLAKAHRVPVYLHPLDLPLYERAPEIAAGWGLSVPKPPPPEGFFEDGDVLEFGPKFRVLHVPGHSPGHVAFFSPEHQRLFSGDVLFKGAVGRYDFPNSDREALWNSLQRLLTLPPKTTVYPGHGPETTLENEAKTNPFLQSGLP